MIASMNAYDLISRFEGFYPMVYNCPAGHATIGIGHKLHNGPMTDNDKKLVWTKSQADAQLKHDTIIVEQALNKAIKVSVNQNQFDALVSWTFNLGIGWLGKCSWMRKLNEEKYSEVPALLMLFDNAIVNGIKTKLPGLTKRRLAEAELFSKPYPQE
jgi:lysozyme